MKLLGQGGVVEVQTGPVPVWEVGPLPPEMTVSRSVSFDELPREQPGPKVAPPCWLTEDCPQDAGHPGACGPPPDTSSEESENGQEDPRESLMRIDLENLIGGKPGQRYQMPDGWRPGRANPADQLPVPGESALLCRYTGCTYFDGHDGGCSNAPDLETAEAKPPREPLPEYPKQAWGYRWHTDRDFLALAAEGVRLGGRSDIVSAFERLSEYIKRLEVFHGE